MKRKTQFVANTFLLTAVSLFLRAVGVSFHAYIAGRIGAAGMGLFSLIMSVYNFGVTFACSGIGLASAKMVSEELAMEREGGARKSGRLSILHGLFFGSVAFGVIFFCAPFVGAVFLGDARTVLPLRILSLSLPCVAMSAAMNGYFSAVGRVGKSAAVQLVEQVVRVALCMALLSQTNDSNAQTACILVVVSGCFAEISSFLVLFALYRKDVIRYERKKVGERILGRILHISLPVAVSSYVRSGLSTIEHAFIPRGLQMHGGDANSALSAYGVVHGMVLPLVLLPSAALQSFSTMLIPEVTMHYKRGENQRLRNLIERALSLTLAFSIGAAGVLFFFAEEIGMAVYQSREAAYFIRVIAPLAVVMYADGVVDAVLKGMNQQVYSMGYNIVDSALAVVLMLYLLPTRGIDGYVAIIYITEMVNAFLSITRLLYIADFSLHPIRWAVIPTLGISACSFFAKTAFSGVFSVFIALILYAGVVLVYFGKRSYCIGKEFVV